MTDATTKPDPLDALAAQAGASMATPPLGEGVTDLDAAGGHAEDAPPPMTNEQALAGALAAGREAFCVFTKLQSPRATLTDDKVQQLAGLWGPVLSKHGIDLGRYLGDYALEVAAVIGTFGIAAAVRAGVQAEMAERKRAAEALPAADSADPGRAE